jgi:2'-5' RNA ligase
VPPAALDESVEQAVAEVIAGFTAFEFSLQDVRRFDDGVLYLAPEPDEPFAALTGALTARWPEYPPYGGGFDSVIPHLTVARANGAPVATMEAHLRGGLPVRTRAEEVWLMEGRVDEGWVKRAVFPLRQT